MSSYQDIETRLITVENKVDFVMKAFSVVDTTNPFARPMTMLDAYYASVAGPKKVDLIVPFDAVDVVDSTPVEEVKE